MPEQPTPEVRREPGQGMATVSRMMRHLEVSEDSRSSTATLATHIQDGSSQTSAAAPSASS